MKIKVKMDSTPIKDNLDLWRALDAAEREINDNTIAMNQWKDIREANIKIFGILKNLVMDYVKEIQEGGDK